MKREVHIFLTAVMFYTRIPCPAWVDHNPDYISKATRYLPLIGWIVGLLYAGSIIVLMNFFPTLLSIVLGLVVSVLLTGAFHEDGFADMCDGFGGGWTKEKILLIMKDSRVGTYGVVGLLLLFTIKIAATYEVIYNTKPYAIVLILVTAHSVSRMMPVIVIRFLSYARDDSDQAKAKPVATGINSKEFFVAIIIALIPLVLLMGFVSPLTALSVIPLVLITLYMMSYFKKWIGGYTGDCLGAIQQLSEAVFLLSIIALWRFI